jgi:hypothetical protein
MTDGRISRGKDGFQAFSRADIPNPDQSIMTGRDDATSIPIEGYCRDGIRMRGKRADALARSDIPEFDGFIKTPRDQQIGGSVELTTKDKIIMPPELYQGITGLCIPQS